MGKVPHERSQARVARREHNFGESTRSVHLGRDHSKAHGIPTPLVQTATYGFADSAELVDYMAGNLGEHREEYGRYGNPTVASLESRLAQMERPSRPSLAGDTLSATSAVCFASGMAALTTLVFAFARQGSHIITFRDGYRRTRSFLTKTLANFGVRCTVVEPSDLQAVAAAITPETRLILAESPTNPYLSCTDITALSKLKGRAKLVVDATFATPCNQRPLELGADFVVHSLTKYVAGHHDVLGGAVIGKAEPISLVRELRGVLGGVLDPHAAFLIARGLSTLALRVERANASALAIARFLEAHEGVERVYYPGLPSHPSHTIAAKQMSGFGGVVSFRPKVRPNESALEAGQRVVDGTRLCTIAPSLGGVESLIEQPSLMSYSELSTEERTELGIHDELIRLAVGIEDQADLLEDLAQALSA